MFGKNSLYSRTLRIGEYWGVVEVSERGSGDQRTICQLLASEQVANQHLQAWRASVQKAGNE